MASARYDDYVEHPRYGRAPRFTGLNPDSLDLDVNLHWANFQPETLEIEGTAIVADLSKQVPATVPVTHYFDLDTLCRDCDRRFVFFAEEQRHWYEELQFPLEALGVRCPECRQARRDLATRRERYRTLVGLESPTALESYETAILFLDLVDAGEFTTKHLDRVRQHLNRAEKELGPTGEIVAARDRCRTAGGET